MLPNETNTRLNIWISLNIFSNIRIFEGSSQRFIFNPDTGRRHSGDARPATNKSTSQPSQQQHSRSSRGGRGSNFGQSSRRGNFHNYYPRNPGMGSSRGRHHSGEDYFFHMDGAPSYGESDPSFVAPVLTGLTYFYNPGVDVKTFSSSLSVAQIKLWTRCLGLWFFQASLVLRLERTRVEHLSGDGRKPTHITSVLTPSA